MRDTKLLHTNPCDGTFTCPTTAKTTTALTATMLTCRSQFSDRVFDGFAFDRAVALCIDKVRSVWNQH